MRRTLGTLMAVGGLAAMIGPSPAAASVEAVDAFIVEAYVIEQQCFGEDDFVDISAATNIPGAAVQFRWDFESEGTLDTGWNADPFERPVYLGDGQDVTATVQARNRARDRATDTVTFTLVDCIPG